jgi:hypothetical protein
MLGLNHFTKEGNLKAYNIYLHENSFSNPVQIHDYLPAQTFADSTHRIQALIKPILEQLMSSEFCRCSSFYRPENF